MPRRSTRIAARVADQPQLTQGPPHLAQGPVQLAQGPVQPAQGPAQPAQGLAQPGGGLSQSLGLAVSAILDDPPSLIEVIENIYDKVQVEFPDSYRLRILSPEALNELALFATNMINRLGGEVDNLLRSSGMKTLRVEHVISATEFLAFGLREDARNQAAQHVRNLKGRRSEE